MQIIRCSSTISDFECKIKISNLTNTQVLLTIESFTSLFYFFVAQFKFQNKQIINKIKWKKLRMFFLVFLCVKTQNMNILRHLLQYLLNADVIGCRQTTGTTTFEEFAQLTFEIDL